MPSWLCLCAVIRTMCSLTYHDELWLTRSEAHVRATYRYMHAQQCVRVAPSFMHAAFQNLDLVVEIAMRKFLQATKHHGLLDAFTYYDDSCLHRPMMPLGSSRFHQPAC